MSVSVRTLILVPAGSFPIRIVLPKLLAHSANEDGATVELAMPAGRMDCEILALVEEEAELFGGKYKHAILQEVDFEEVPEARAQLQ